MSGSVSPTAAFFLNPEKFCESNFVYPGALGDEDGVFWVGLDVFDHLPLNSATLVKCTRKGKQIPCYTLNKRPSEDDAFRTYWCPYKQNGIAGVAIGREAKFMFTVQLNGCSLGLGSETSDGSRLVRHVNMSASGPKEADAADVRPAKQEQQAQHQRILIRQEGDFGSQIVQPQDYRTRGKDGLLKGEANVFGVFIDSKWVIKALKYNTVKVPGLWTFEHKGIKEVFAVS
jgi:hypothetical protein